MNGNHEMCANGNAYFDTFLKVLGIPPQKIKLSSQASSAWRAIIGGSWASIPDTTLPASQFWEQFPSSTGSLLSARTANWKTVSCSG
jgi:hypothetical protein